MLLTTPTKVGMTATIEVFVHVRKSVTGALKVSVIRLTFKDKIFSEQFRENPLPVSVKKVPPKKEPIFNFF